MEALGILEVQGLANAIMVADVMVKTAAVEIIELERANGKGWTTVKITGNVGAVNAAVTAGRKTGEACSEYVSSKVIPRPDEQMAELFAITGKAEQIEAETKDARSVPETDAVSEPAQELTSDTEENKKRQIEAETAGQPEDVVSETGVQETGAQTVPAPVVNPKPAEETELEAVAEPIAETKAEAAAISAPVAKVETVTVPGLKTDSTFAAAVKTDRVQAHTETKTQTTGKRKAKSKKSR